jgi:hypothetical protein
MAQCGGAGFVCQLLEDTHCPANGSLGECRAIPGPCLDGTCATNDGTAASYFKPTPAVRVFCLNNVPTLSQWGLILFGMLLLTAMFITIRRRGLPTQMSASLLVLLSAGVMAVSVSYAEIQSNRVCGETDVAVNFVADIFELKG